MPPRVAKLLFAFVVFCFGAIAQEQGTGVAFLDRPMVVSTTIAEASMPAHGGAVDEHPALQLHLQAEGAPDLHALPSCQPVAGAGLRTSPPAAPAETEWRSACVDEPQRPPRA